MGSITAKIVLRKDKEDKRGQCPLYLRTTKNRKTKYTFLQLKVEACHWNKVKGLVRTSYPNSVRFNNRLKKIIFEQEQEASSGIDEIKSKTKESNPIDFFNFAKEHLALRLKEEKFSTYDKEKSVLKKFKTYVDGSSFEFSRFTPQFLDNYKAHLKYKVKNKTNTIHANFRVLRMLINKAERYKYISPDDNPFKYYKLEREETKREFLTIDELQELKNLWLPKNSLIYQHRQLFLFACYACGLRVSDLLTLRPSNIKNGFVDMKMKKVRSKRLRFKLLPEAKEILDEFYDPTNMFVFPFVKLEDEDSKKELDKQISRCTAYYNKNLRLLATKCDFDKHLSSHVARNTFATLALSQGVRIEYVSKLLGHSNIKTTQIYSKIIDRDLETEMQKLSFR